MRLLKFAVSATILMCLKATGCGSDFHAVGQANTKYSKDYTTSGVVACVCARHSLMQKNGVGDLQRGERYVSSVPADDIQILTIAQIHKHGLRCRICLERARCPQCHHLLRYCMQMVHSSSRANFRQPPRSRCREPATLLLHSKIPSSWPRSLVPNRLFVQLRSRRR